ncbi:MAG: hypothetical protein KF905_03660 [Flavobacteriales bacterium]|nr:hypothetical protein [Flavobacteriales bacterium]
MPAEQDARSLLLSIALCLIALVIWILLYSAQFKEYDENYADIIYAFLISMSSGAWLGFVQWKAPQVVRSARWFVLGFLVLASPITVILVVTNYWTVFGAGLKL